MLSITLLCGLALTATGFAPLQSPGRASTRVSMSDDNKGPTIIRSGRKDIAFDQARGRFFETSLNQEECSTEDEFCVTDKESGKLIRLTIEEKERIFLDALQVSAIVVSLLLLLLLLPMCASASRVQWCIEHCTLCLVDDTLRIVF
jgi:hypothetical protein